MQYTGIVNPGQSLESEKRRLKFIAWWISASITVPILLDFVFLGSSVARYSRLVIFLAIGISLLLNTQVFLSSKMVGTETLLISAGIFLIGTTSEIIRGGPFTPNFAMAFLILFIISANMDLYRSIFAIIAANVHFLTAASTVAIVLQANPKELYFSEEGYPVFFDFLGIPGRNYGVFAHPNGLGQVAAISLLLIIASKSNRSLMIFPLFCLFKSGSRTSISSVAVGLILYFAILVFRRRQSSGKSLNLESKIVYGTFTLGILMAGTYQFMISIGFLDPTAFTRRASIWQATVTLFKTSPTFGLGWNWETRAIESQLINVWATSAHNAILDVCISTGTIGLLMFFILLSKSLAYFPNLELPEKIVLTSTLVSGISESYVNLQYPTVATIFFLVIVLAANRKKEKTDA